MNKSEIVRAHLPCPDTLLCGSSNAYAERADGSGYCFSCHQNFRNSEAVTDVPSERITSLQVVPMRGLSEATERFYNVKTEVTESGTPVARHYTYPSGWAKVRTLPEKKFYSVGQSVADLYGIDKFSSGASRVITITEGEEDAHACFQMLGGKYPVVSVRSSSTAKADCTARHKDLNAFDKIYICFDNDAPGKAAAAAVASLFDFNKVYTVNLSRLKDPNEYLLDGAGNEFSSLWYNAKRYLPDGIVSSFGQFSDIIRGKRKAAFGTYPIKQLQDMAYGFRGGEVVLITAQSGIGKTEVVRLIEHHLLKEGDYNIAAIHIEEDENRQLRGLASYELKMPCHLENTVATDEEIDQALQKLIKRSDRLHLYTHFGSDDPDIILGKMRFLMSAAECKILFLDHISMVVSGLMADDERKLLDKLSTDIAVMAKDLDTCVVMVSHVNDNDQTRGSRNIEKVAHLHLHLYRDLESNDSTVRNTTNIFVKKNRHGSQTGPGGSLYFDPANFMLTEITDIKPAVLPPVG